jgi:hypothetical protein
MYSSMVKGTRLTKKPGRVIKRKPGSSKSTMYFTNDTELSILKFQKEKDVEIRKEIFSKEILTAFSSLAENLINTYGYSPFSDTKKDLKEQCVSFLYTVVHKYDGTKNSKAFSYFNVVAKNWLTINSKKNVKRIQSHVSLDDEETITSSDLEMIETHNHVPSFEEELEKSNVRQNLIDMIDEVEDMVKTEQEKIVIWAIKTIVSDIDNLEMFNKRAILVYLRELTGFNSKQVSSIVNSLRKYYRDVRTYGFTL